MRAMKVGQLIIAVLLTFATVVRASRRYRPMGAYVREAGLIVVANTRRGGRLNFEIIASVAEVIKGDPKAAGTEILLSMRRMSTAHARVPTPATDVVILLRKDWREEKGWPVLEAYAKAEEVAAVRVLVEVYRLPGERQRLLALREKALGGNTYCLAQLLADLKDMREPDNFDVMTALHGALAPANQAKLVEIIARTGDARAVPALLKAMRSPDERASATAASQLFWKFPGAPGVTEAFEKALTREHLARQAARYLAKRRDDPALDEIIGGKETSSARARRLWEAGEMKAARTAYLTIVEDRKASEYGRRSAATKLMPNASVAEKESIRKALLPQLLADARGNNYLYANAAARILRQLHHPDCLEALLALPRRVDFRYRRAARTAALAIRELGPGARQQAIALLIDDLGSGVAKKASTRTRTPYLLDLIWLGDEESFGKVKNVMPDSWRSAWTALSPLRVRPNEKDEGAFLARLLTKSVKLPPGAREWVAFRLGDLKEKRAVEALTEMLTREPDWALTGAARDALIAIGGPEVEDNMLKLLTHKDHNRVRRAAINVLFRLQGERSRDLSRRMLREEDFGVKRMAMMNLGTSGTVEDLALLLPCCDYWKADRATHYWAMGAVASIRERHNYDVNGPIVKNSAKK